MKKTITITLKEASTLEVPAHLKGQSQIDVKVDGLTAIQSLQIMSGVLNGMVNDYITGLEKIVAPNR